MNVIEGVNVDLISPFPSSHIHRIYGWMACYKNIVETDVSPQTEDEFVEFYKNAFANSISFGVIDKNNSVGSKASDAPIVGMVAFEGQSPWNAYIHLASNRKAWKGRLMDEATSLSIKTMFDEYPGLMRISGFCLAENRPVRMMAPRLGFVKEGEFRSWAMRNGEPLDALHYGLTRERFKEV